MRLGWLRKWGSLITRQLDQVEPSWPDSVSLFYQRVLSRLLRSQVQLDRLQNGFFFAEGDGRVVVVGDRSRLSRYRHGVAHRLDDLRLSYSLDGVRFGKSAVIVDCGANIGELALSLPDSVRYIGIEPDPKAFAALTMNLTGATLLDVALSDEPGRGQLLIATATADSTLLPDGTSKTQVVEVDVVRLDDITEDLRLEAIDLLKIEAEGLEPEVLRGALKTLHRTRLVAIDVGPERYGCDTAADCLNILYAAGFRIRSTRLRRGRVLLEREIMA